MNNVSELYQYMISDLGSCPKNVALGELRKAAVQFFEETEGWTIDLTWDVVADQRDYKLKPKFDVLVKRLVEVSYGEEGETSPLDPCDYELVEPLTVRLDTAYTTALASALHATIAVVPVLKQEPEIDPVVLDRWGMRGIRTMALYSCLMKPGAWMNEKQAMRFFNEAKRAKGQARIELETSRKGGDVYAYARDFLL